MSVDEIAAAQSLQKIGKDFGQIAKILGLHINTIRSQLDAPYFEKCRETMTKMRERRVTRVFRFKQIQDTRDLTGQLMGDPPFERSALGMKLRQEAERQTCGSTQHIFPASARLMIRDPNITGPRSIIS